MQGDSDELLDSDADSDSDSDLGSWMDRTAAGPLTIHHLSPPIGMCRIVSDHAENTCENTVAKFQADGKTAWNSTRRQHRAQAQLHSPERLSQGLLFVGHQPGQLHDHRTCFLGTEDALAKSWGFLGEEGVAGIDSHKDHVAQLQERYLDSFMFDGTRVASGDKLGPLECGGRRERGGRVSGSGSRMGGQDGAEAQSHISGDWCERQESGTPSMRNEMGYEASNVEVPRPGEKAKIFQAQANYEDAFACFQKASEILPKSVSAMFGLGQIYLYKGDMAQAAACFEKVLTVEPNDYPTLTGPFLLMIPPEQRLGSIYARMPEKRDRAENVFETLRKQLRAHYIQVGRPATTLKDDDVLEQPNVLMDVGLLAEQNHLPKAALAAYEKAAQKLTEDSITIPPELHNNIAALHHLISEDLRLHPVAAQRVAADEAKKMTDAVAVALKAVAAAVKLGPADKALAESRLAAAEAAAAIPIIPAQHRHARAAAKRYRLAREACDAQIADPAMTEERREIVRRISVVVRYNQGRLAEATGDIVEAEKIYKAILGEVPGYTDYSDELLDSDADSDSDSDLGSWMDRTAAGPLTIHHLSPPIGMCRIVSDHAENTCENTVAKFQADGKTAWNSTRRQHRAQAQLHSPERLSQGLLFVGHQPGQLHDHRTCFLGTEDALAKSWGFLGEEGVAGIDSHKDHVAQLQERYLDSFMFDGTRVASGDKLGPLECGGRRERGGRVSGSGSRMGGQDGAEAQSHISGDWCERQESGTPSMRNEMGYEASNVEVPRPGEGAAVYLVTLTDTCFFIQQKTFLDAREIEVEVEFDLQTRR
ncbi:hypothetical protein BDK51DRAFT_46353 [Blyttiomyces helicus]|uniref:Uncharacterized protein n=1 Tax=Blyttiomyces helicus TaxID=388810 RepID=A0A4P9WH46_9FUNG|nr:hypothetical protein BDK51DRAFT_46353 [Blyttiomyces helicus]|eukprot:RKO90718.1 hypothetical protein BDK51DRAFT_46353 [Blyttiomyces helicus]